MYAIIFDLDQEILLKTYGLMSCCDAYGDIEKILVRCGFLRQYGSFYFGGDEKINAVSCVLAVQTLAKTYSWFTASVRTIRMLRIADDTDLRSAIERFSRNSCVGVTISQKTLS